MSSYTVAQNTSFFTIGSVLQKVISFFYFILIARLVGVENTGQYFFAITFTTIFAVVADFGMAPTLTRELSRFPEKSEGYLNTVFWTKIIFGVLVYLLVVFFANLLKYPQLTKDLIYLSGLTMFFDNLHSVFYSVFRSRKNLIYESIGLVGSQFLTMIIGTVALLGGWPLIWLIAAYAIPSFLNFIYAAYFVKRRYGLAYRPAWDRKIFKNFLQMAIPFALAGIIGRLYSYSDSLIMSKVLSAKELGWWSIPYKVTFAFQFFPIALSASVYPVFSDFFINKKSEIAPLFEKSWRYLFTIVFPISFGLIAVADPVIKIVYGKEYAPSILPLRILMISLIFSFLSFITGALLNAINRQKTQTTIMAVALGLNIVLNLALLPVMSIAGAAIAALASNIALVSLGFYLAKKDIPLNLKNICRQAMRVFWPALAMGLVVYFFSDKINFMILILSGAVVYFGLLFASGAMDKETISRLILKVKLSKNNQE